MVKDDIARRIASATGCTVRDVSRITDAFLDNVMSEVAIGNSVKLSGFGTFEPAARKERIGRNVKKGIPVKIPARVIPVFRASKEFKEKVMKENENG